MLEGLIFFFKQSKKLALGWSVRECFTPKCERNNSSYIYARPQKSKDYNVHDNQNSGIGGCSLASLSYVLGFLAAD